MCGSVAIDKYITLSAVELINRMKQEYDARESLTDHQLTGLAGVQWLGSMVSMVSMVSMGMPLTDHS